MDANNLVTPGKYAIFTGVGAEQKTQTAVKHWPNDQWGVLEVIKDGGYNNRTFQILTGPNYQARRVSEDNGSIWSSWQYDYQRYSNGTMYLDQVNGDDNNTGFRSDTPVRSIERAYEIIHSHDSVPQWTIYFGPGNWGSITWVQLNNSTLAFTNVDENDPAIFDVLYIVNAPNAYVRNLHVKNLRMSNSNLTSQGDCVIKQLLVSLGSIFINQGKLIFQLDDGDNFSNIDAITVQLGSRFRQTGPIEIKPNCVYRRFLTSAGMNNHLEFINFVTPENFTGIKYYISEWVTSTGSPLDELPGTSAGFGAYQSYQRFNFLTPIYDNVSSLGSAERRWSEVFAGTGTINTSDERFKDNVKSYSDEVLQAWGEVEFVNFQFKDSLKKKGPNARIHSGLLAQRVIEVFNRHGLDASKYGLLCYDEWETEDYDEEVIESPEQFGPVKVIDKPASGDESEQYHFEIQKIKDAVYTKVHHHKDGGDLYGIRYEEALCLEAAYQRWRANKLEERIAALEAKLA